MARYLYAGKEVGWVETVADTLDEFEDVKDTSLLI